MDKLLDHNADVNIPMRNGSTPLVFAAQKDNKEALEVLMLNGASVDQADKNGFTPLHRAAQNGHVEVATALLDAGTIADEGPALRARSGGIFSRMLTAMSPRKGRDEHEDHPQEESVTPDESPHVDPGDVVVKPIAALGAAVASAA